MENIDEPLSGRDSLQIIQQMIDTAKQEQKDDGQGWIVWGWMLFLASTLTVVNMRMHWTQPFYFWNAFGLFTIVYFCVKIARNVLKKDRQPVKTYTKDLFDKLNTGFFISLMFVIVAMNAGLNHMKGFPLLMSVYGFWILIYGAVLNFKPSTIGAFIMWALAFTALFVKTFEWIMILHSVGVLFGYIIPGHIAYKRFREVGKHTVHNQQAGV